VLFKLDKNKGIENFKTNHQNKVRKTSYRLKELELVDEK
jgi:hypothetical protein